MTPAAARPPAPPAELHVGLVNNMPDAAFLLTERQFARLLRAAAGGRRVRLHRTTLPEISRGPAVTAQIAARYLSLGEMFERPLDGLIVTGREPRTSDLRAEPYWPSFRRLADWAREHTRSTVWSCLAAHAAVLHLHGIERRPLGRKLAGVFARRLHGGAALGLTPYSPVPHSRQNTLDAGELVRRGYALISEVEGGQPDTFALDAGSRFLFLQGHPEYEADTLKLEYERDVRRFLEGRLDSPPPVPTNYFEAKDEPSAGGDPLAWLAQALPPPGLPPWRDSAVAFYSAWLDGLAGRALEPPAPVAELYSAA